MATVWSLPLRFRKKIRIEDGCWVWTGAKFKKGYGRVSYMGKSERAHRAVFHIINGYMPIDTHHTCKTKACVNPAHLESKTRLEHKRLHHKTHCPKGHEYTVDNTYIAPDGRRACRTCVREARGVKKQRGPYGRQRNPRKV